VPRQSLRTETSTIRHDCLCSLPNSPRDQQRDSKSDNLDPQLETAPHTRYSSTLSLDRDTRIPAINLELISRHCGLLGDPTRLRLLALLESEELTVAELAQITRLAQPRVSTHLARLREAGLVLDRREGVSVYYRMQQNSDRNDLRMLWVVLSKSLDDALLQADQEQLTAILNQRLGGRTWPDSVAGDMERHYSPGRTWEATARALVHLLKLGRVLDIASGDGVMAELLADRADSVDCIDSSERVVDAGRTRLDTQSHVRFHCGDMHDLPFEPNRFDTVLLLHALTYSDRAGQVFAEAARVLAPGGQLLGATLARHRFQNEVRTYGHVTCGFTSEQIERWIRKAGLEPRFCEVTSVERRTPNFEILTFLADKR
jgi:ArsR family transcriptional regulator